jgi:Fic family protein
MLSLDPDRLERVSVPVSTVWLLAECMEARGRQDLWTRQKPEILKALRDRAIVQSAESSNRIEGITVPPERLQPLVLGNARPRDRSEAEIRGYRKALDRLFRASRPAPISPDTLLRLHALAQGDAAGDAGRWKSRDNEIQEILPGGRRIVRFKTVPAKRTPAFVGSLCTNFVRLEEAGTFPLLLLDFLFVFDLSCIHPFRDGNGRVCRLATVLLLLRHGFEVCRYVSLERLIEENREDYYESLKRSSTGWHEGKSDPTPWWNHSLSMLREAYREFSERVEKAAGSLGKSDLVRLEIERREGPFSLADLRKSLPSVSPALIKKILLEMKKGGGLILTGRGRGSRWERKR